MYVSIHLHIHHTHTCTYTHLVECFPIEELLQQQDFSQSPPANPIPTETSKGLKAVLNKYSLNKWKKFICQGRLAKIRIERPCWCPTYQIGVLIFIIFLTAAAAAANSLHSCLTLCDPIDGSPPGCSVPGILQARILEWVAISFSNVCMHAKSLQLGLTLYDPMESSPPRLLCPRDSPGKNTGVGCHFLLFSHSYLQVNAAWLRDCKWQER